MKTNTTKTKTVKILTTTIALAIAGLMSASCGGGGGTAMTPADYDRQIATDAALTEAQAEAARLIDGPAVTENSNMASIIETAASGARSAAKGSAPVTETLPATIKYEYDTKLVTIAITFPNGLPSKTGASCDDEQNDKDKKNEKDDQKKTSADKTSSVNGGGADNNNEDNNSDKQDNENNSKDKEEKEKHNNGKNDHIVFKIYKTDGAIIRGVAKEGRVSIEKHHERDNEDLDSDNELATPKVRGSYTITGNNVTIQFTDTFALFNGSLEDFTTMKLLNRSEKCVFGKYTINLAPAVETITTTTKPAPGASADSSYNAWYVPEKAFDGDYKSWWVGSTAATSWNLYYAFPAAQKMDRISVNYYGPAYVPATTTLWTSLDGFHWTKTAILPAGNSKPSVAINKTVGFIWFQMSGTPAIGYPLVRDIDWMPISTNYGAYAEPGENDDWYFPSNAFDGNLTTWWVGKTNVQAWDIYYGYKTAAKVNTITVYYYSDKHAPATTTLYISADGINWTFSASLPCVPTATFTIGAAIQYFKINMQGVPAAGYPLVKDISIK